MPTYSALTTLDGQEAAEALGEAIEAMEPTPVGVGTFEIEDGSGLWEVGAYFVEKPDETGLMLLAMAFGARPFTLSELPEIDWVAKVKRELCPVEAGRFFVYGSHDADKVPADCEPLLIEAAMAFGTGHHGTTLGCLRALDRLSEGGFQGENVADIGCGTAVLGMAAARIWPNPVMVSDIDEVAVDVATVPATSEDTPAVAVDPVAVAAVAAVPDVAESTAHAGALWICTVCAAFNRPDSTTNIPAGKVRVTYPSVTVISRSR